MFSFPLNFNIFSGSGLFSSFVPSFSFSSFPLFNFSSGYSFLSSIFSGSSYSFDLGSNIQSRITTSSYDFLYNKAEKVVKSLSDVSGYNPSSLTRTYKRLLKSAKDGYGKPFLDKVKQISKEINCDYRDLLAVMNSESGIDAHKPCMDPSSSAVGLIQFTKDARNDLHVTKAQLMSMSPIQQLDYVKKFYLNWKKVKGYSANKKLSGGELYALTYTPGYLKSNSKVLAKRGMREYDKNKGLDMNKDGYITVDDLSQRVSKFSVSESSFLA